MNTILNTNALFPGQSASGVTSHNTVRPSAQTQLRLIVAALGLSAALVMTAGAAESAPTKAPPWIDSQTIRFRVADLQTPEGARRLAQRIRSAAAYVCDGEDPVLRSSSGFRDCVSASIRRAIIGLNAPLLAQALDVPPTSGHTGQLASRADRPD